MKSNLFMVLSMVLGVLSIMTCPFFFLSFPAAGLGIIFAVLSKGERMKMEIMPKAGTATSIVGMTLSAVITIGVIVLILTSSVYRQSLNEASKEMYGITMDEMFQERYGVTLESIAQRFG